MYKGNLIKETSLNVHVVPKLLNLDFGLDFQIEMVKAAEVRRRGWSGNSEQILQEICCKGDG